MAPSDTAKEKEEEITDDQLLSLPFKVKKDDLFYLVDLAKDYAISKGTCIRASQFCMDARVPIPFSLFPSPFPQKHFSLVKSIQPDLNHVLHMISYAPDFLKLTLKNTLKADPFIANIFKIYEIVLKEGILQHVSLGLLRSDYLLHEDSSNSSICIKQVENNTISTSNSAVIPNVSELHVFILNRLGVQDIYHKLPENKADINVAKGIIAAWNIYNNKSAAILFVIEEVPINICDQRNLEFKIYQLENKIHIMRRTFPQLRKNIELKNHRLFVDGKEIAIVYYRCGYLPEHYQDEDWKTRLYMEKSLAIKCPTVGYHLAGTKRIQLELLKPGVLEQFLPENSNSHTIRQVFAKQFALDMNKEGDSAIALALNNPDHYVLKPEREGGGNNFYGRNLEKVLKSIKSSELRQAYILMEKMKPPSIANCLVGSSYPPKIKDIVCELGIYGVIVGTQNHIYANYEAGHILKTKEVHLNEGGIVAGFGVLDTPFLQ